MTSMEPVAKAVAQAGGLRKYTMAELRDAYGAGKLGRHVVAGISRELTAQGCGHFGHPDPDLPLDQNSIVRVYKKATPVGDLIEAVLNPSDAGDKKLGESAGGSEADLLRRVREIVCE